MTEEIRKIIESSSYSDLGRVSIMDTREFVEISQQQYDMFYKLIAVLMKNQEEHPDMHQLDVINTIGCVIGFVLAEAPDEVTRERAIVLLNETVKGSIANFVSFLKEARSKQ